MRNRYKFTSWLQPDEKLECCLANLEKDQSGAGLKLSERTRVLIANGEGTSIWHDPWLADFPLSKSAFEVSWSSEHEFREVSFLILNREWDVNRVEEVLGRNLAGLVAEISIDPELNKDVTVWGEEYLVKPRVKHFYAAMSSPTPNREYHFDRIWKIQAPPTVKIFIWKACIGKLPTGEFVAQFGIRDGYCPRCPGILESADHLLFDCRFAARVWRAVEAKWGEKRLPANLTEFMRELLSLPVNHSHAWKPKMLIIYMGFGKKGTP